MPSSRYRTTVLFVILLTLIFTYLPMPVSSSPIIVFQDQNSLAPNSSHIDNKLVFDVAFAFALLIVLLITFVWIASRMTVDFFISWVTRLWAASVTLVERLEQVADQLPYLRLDTLFRIATSILVDADDVRRDPTRPMGGLANPRDAV